MRFAIATAILTATLLLAPAAAGATPGVIVRYGADDDPVLMSQIVAAVGYVATVFGTGPIVVTSDWMEPGLYAGSYESTIVINKYWTHDPVGLARSVAYDVAFGHVRGGCTAAATIGLHEASHVLDNRHGKLADLEAILAYGDGTILYGQLAGYSFKKFPSEALACAFQAVQCNGGTAAERALYRMLVS